MDVLLIGKKGYEKENLTQSIRGVYIIEVEALRGSRGQKNALKMRQEFLKEDLITCARKCFYPFKNRLVVC